METVVSKAQAECDAWNAKYKVGQKAIVTSTMGSQHSCTLHGEAYLYDKTPFICIDWDGRHMLSPLQRVTPIEDKPAEPADVVTLAEIREMAVKLGEAMPIVLAEVDRLSAVNADLIALCRGIKADAIATLKLKHWDALNAALAAAEGEGS